jgi:adenine phosphoribosyltransferase
MGSGLSPGALTRGAFSMEDDIIDSLYGSIRTVPDFPIEGIMFRDITPVLADGELLTSLVDRMIMDMDALDWQPTHIAGPESRGFIFGSMVAERLGVGFVPIRKPGVRARVRVKRPGDPFRRSRSRRQGSDSRRPSGNRRNSSGNIESL